MSFQKFFLQVVISSFAALALNASAAHAQSNVWNTPSTDVQPQGAVYVEADFISHLASYENGGFQIYGARVVYGARKRLEVSTNAYFTRLGDTPQPVEVQPGVKWQFYQNEDKGLQASAGGMLYVPVARRAGTDTFGMIYSSVSKKVKAAYGPRMTGGVYALPGRDKGLGTRAGTMVAFEQPLHPKVSFVADWYSGKNRFGYAGGGLVITISKRSVLLAGYNIGNEGRRNNYLSVFYGYTF